MRYQARRISTGEWIDRDLALRDVENTVTLSGPGTIAANLAPGTNAALWQDRLRVAEDNATMIYALDDNDNVVNHGIVLPPTAYDDVARITCAGVSSYPQGYIYTGSKMWGPQMAQPKKKNSKGKVIRDAIPFLPHPDPIELFREHWRWIQNRPNSDLGVTIDGPENTGKRQKPQDTREPVIGLGTNSEPYRLRYYETPDLGEELSNLAELTPFDFREVVKWNGGDPDHRIEIGWPRLGRQRDDLRFAEGENIVITPSVQTLEGAANMLIGIGNGDAGPRMAYGELPWDDGRLRRHRVITDKGASASRIQKRLLWWKDVMSAHRYDVTSVAIVDHPNARLSQLQLGDDVRVLAEHPEYGPIDMWVRILSITRGDYDEAAVLTTSGSALFSYRPNEEFS